MDNELNQRVSGKIVEVLNGGRNAFAITSLRNIAFLAAGNFPSKFMGSRFSLGATYSFDLRESGEDKNHVGRRIIHCENILVEGFVYYSDEGRLVPLGEAGKVLDYALSMEEGLYHFSTKCPNFNDAVSKDKVKYELVNPRDLIEMEFVVHRDKGMSQKTFLSDGKDLFYMHTRRLFGSYFALSKLKTGEKVYVPKDYIARNYLGSEEVMLGVDARVFLS